MSGGNTYSNIIKDSVVSGKAMFWATALLAFLMPLMKAGIQFPIILLGLVWLFSPKPSLKANWKPILVFSAIYIFHIIGMLYTDNVLRGLNDLEQKFSLLLFPLVFGVCRPFSRKEIFWLLGFFTMGTIISVLISFGTSAINYQQSQNIRDFYMSAFSPQHHPSYIAMYMNFASAFLLLTIFLRHFVFKRQVIIWFAIVFLTLSLIFPASKMGFLCFLVSVMYTIAFAFMRGVLKHVNTLILILLAVVFVLYVNFDPIAKIRVESAIESSTQDAVEPDKQNKSSTEFRVLAWNIALDEIAKNPGGVGTGDINDVLVNRYESEGLRDMARMGMNPHNNFMQIALALGIVPLLIFIFSLLYPLRRIIINKDWLYGFFLVLIFMNLMVESMLEKQSGVIFFAFFNALLFFSHKTLPDPK